MMGAFGKVGRIAGALLVILSLGFLIFVGRRCLEYRLVSVPAAPEKTTLQTPVTLETLLGEDYVEQDWKLILVNSENTLPENFAVELAQLADEQAVDARIAGELETMLEDARAEGLSPVVCSSYRTEELQQTLYSNKVARLLEAGYSLDEAQTEAARWVARPGTSEHQLGLAVDIVAESYPVLDVGQEDTPEQQWLLENAYRYGFVLRYPEGKSEITGIGYEPWHYRYVGREAAEQMYWNDLCLEEYLAGR